MKRMNNGRFRQSGGNSIYSLNYKFDSISSAGKFSGTALDLIKKYNELAKEAHSNGDYVEMEVFRQYAEHYRKIVTEINERKNQNRDNQNAESGQETPVSEAEPAPVSEDNGLVETQGLGTAEIPAQGEEPENAIKTTVRRRRSFTIVEVTSKENEAQPEMATTAEPVEAEKPRRRTLKRKTATTEDRISEEK